MIEESLALIQFLDANALCISISSACGVSEPMADPDSMFAVYGMRLILRQAHVADEAVPWGICIASVESSVYTFDAQVSYFSSHFIEDHDEPGKKLAHMQASRHSCNAYVAPVIFTSDQAHFFPISISVADVCCLDPLAWNLRFAYRTLCGKVKNLSKMNWSSAKTANF
jgi:hypothetical protein